MFILELLKKQELEALRFLNDPSNICIDSYNNEYLDCALDNQIISYIHSDVLWVLNSNETDFITFESNKMRITFQQNIVDKHTVVSYFFLKIKESIELSISLAQRHFQQNNQDLIKTLKKHPMILSNLLLLSEYFSLDTFFIDSSKNVDNSYFYFAVIDEDRIKFISFDDYELQAKKKRIYEQFVVEMYEYYIQRGYLSSKLIILNTWLAVKVEKIDNMDFLDSIDLGRITDYIMSDYFIPEFDKLHKMNIEDVFIKAKEWETRNQNKKFKESKNDIEVVIKEDNYSLVKLKTTNALKRESSQMGHCVGNGGYDHSVNKGHIEIYSLRDQSNQSIATIEYIKEQKKINQIKGKKIKRLNLNGMLFYNI